MKSKAGDLFCRVPGCELKGFRFRTKEALRAHTIRKHPLPEEARATPKKRAGSLFPTLITNLSNARPARRRAVI